MLLNASVKCRHAAIDWEEEWMRPPLDLRLYAVTDPACNARWGRSDAEAIALALRGGATIVQVSPDMS